MKRYDIYKDSGIEWIGEIPGHWGIKKIKHRCYVKARVGWKGLKSDEFLSKGYAYLVTGSDFKNDSVDWDQCYHIDKERYDEDPYIQLQNEDLLITKDGTIGKLAIVRGLDKPACLNSGIFVVRPIKDDFSTEFLFWLLKSKTFTDFNGYTSYGSTIQHLYQNVFVEYAFPFPSLKEQTAIAHYLDRKTVEIDALIADKKRLLELYEEEKTAIINQAVTKGLNPDAPMRDSGIEWLGEVPVEWEVKKVKWVHQTTSGGTPKTSDSENYNGEIPWLRTLDLNNDKVNNYEITITEKALSESSAKIVPSNSVLVAMYGGSGTIGKSGLLKFDSAINQAICAILPNKNTLPEYLHYFIMFFRPYWMVGAEGTRRDPNISQDDIKNKEFVFPPLEEQQSIVRHIETECADIDAKIAKTEKLIALLTEYRTVLISEVVTGKVKVTA